MTINTKTTSELSEEAKKMYAESAARSMEDLVSRLKTDPTFAPDLQKDPRGTLEGAGIKLEKEAIELLISRDASRFDQVCDALFELLDPTFLSQLVGPSCGTTIEKSPSRYHFKPTPSKR